ncbi:ABC transporter ATP-binding protein [Mucilaginibacter dorajii]|uniref:ABC transporter domain-containing protein n=1 Tax=Mucilaginibacter dorajii TaxID=692994 RepID=A0ABP7Q330_9SPHI|nr:ABC transporter ATP-binding protein [Mucilaginibacter dorajii]MCS3732755.1 ABC-type polysaccharide/polyol phosphate transport system ATPase subunit [Mucilaginibacter dorajii]
MPPVIKAENLSKAYQLGEIGTGTLSRDLERYWAKIRGKEDPFLKIGEVNDRTKKGQSDVVWSLKDINFDIEQGDAVGIIGKNGAGKSTLLKILSRVTAPTTGSVKLKGRIASLLEVGTGFHPELSGRENIYLNGAILGMRKAEIKRNFDEIVDFSGVERYIDTPVKRYSSGMYVRLAFAVAAHLEAEILIVDEVLAVGDAEFQKKCLGKMGEVSKGEGRTVLFVSHNMASISQLCNKAILLNNGKLDYFDYAASTINEYLKTDNSQAEAIFKANKSLSMSVLSASLINKDGKKSSEIALQSNFTIKVTYQVNTPQRDVICAVGIMHQGTPINTTWTEPATLQEGIYHTYFQMDLLHLAIGTYTIGIGLSIGKSNIQYIGEALIFTIELDRLSDSTIVSYEANTGLLINQMKFETIKDNEANF